MIQRAAALLVPAGFFVVGLCIAACIGGIDRVPEATLANTYWKLIDLDDRVLVEADWPPPPHLTFSGDLAQVSGAGGCNRLSGACTVKDTALTFQPMAMTKMACARGMETEQAFSAALERTRRWRIVNNVLELSDESGSILARLAAVAPST